MNLNRYNFSTEQTHTSYEFTSEGRNGTIRKGVNFEPVDANSEIYNLAFGDFDETGHINDLSVSDNQDRDKILATVAAIVIDFSECHPEVKIIGTGSTHARTRLYRMSIAKNYENISQIFDIEGYAGFWMPFTTGIDFQAFSIRRKII